MFRSLACGLVAAFSVGVACARAEVAVPDTPAGRALGEWLGAVNSGDAGQVQRFVSRYEPPQSVAELQTLHNRVGGYDLLNVQSVSPSRVKFRVKRKTGPIVGAGILTLKAGPSPQIEVFVLRGVPPGAEEQPVVIDRAYRKTLIDEIRADLNQFYIDAGLAGAMARTLEAREQAGAYEGETDGDVLAARLQADLRSVSHDRHLTVAFSPFRPPPQQAAPSPEDVARARDQYLGANCLFDEVKILPGNIGYVKFDGFAPPEICGPTVASAMGFVAHAKAVIFDLRENGGGSPDMVTFIASYLFAQPTHLNDLYTRQTNETRQFWTTAQPPDSTLAKAPVYLLTSAFTFSGAEEFAYDLAEQKRATIVGETTGGGAHPVAPHPVQDHFVVGIPFATAVNPVSKTSWEGTGVEPNVKVAAADALETAVALAKQGPPKSATP